MPDIAQIKRELSARRLLAELAYTHGLQPHKYHIWQAKDGSERIRAGTRNFNVADFLTKEVNLPWREAQGLLREIYTRQIRMLPPRREPVSPSAALWQQYLAYRTAAQAAKARDTAIHADSVRSRRQALLTQYRAERDAIKGDDTLSPALRRSKLSVARMGRVSSEQALSHQVGVERSALRQAHPSVTYAHFLQLRAQNGDVHALEALQRLQLRGRPAPSIQADCILAGHANREPNQILYRAPQLTYTVLASGEVLYRQDDRDMVQDEGASVLVLERERAAIETGLRLAQIKFGDELKLSGSRVYQEQAARVAAIAGLRVHFDDETLNDIMRSERLQLVDAQLATTERRLGDLAAGTEQPAQDSPGTSPALQRGGPSL